MIYSMTAFGSAQIETEAADFFIELRGVNSRYLDLNFRLADDLRLVESSMREMIKQTIKRGKLEVRATMLRKINEEKLNLDEKKLNKIAELLNQAQTVVPGVPAPRLIELINWPGMCESDEEPDALHDTVINALQDALSDFSQNREREGLRLAKAMLEHAAKIEHIVLGLKKRTPELMNEYREKLSSKLKETLENVFSNGITIAHISGEELFARISTESSIFSLRIDVTEELTRLESHCVELKEILTGAATHKSGSKGKRLEFLFQEMNREANTLASKSSAMEVTEAAINLKLLIEQMREQAQNVE